jgi:hypothetical protein
MGALRALYPATEAEGRCGSSALTPADAVNHAPCRADAATGEVSPLHLNAVAIRRSFPLLWAEYLRERYRTAYAVQRAFGIDGKTARDWIGGKRDPSGSFVATVVARDPDAIKILGGME